MADDYIPRLVDPVIDNYLRLFGATVITGLKWCGKTTSSTRLAKTVISLQDRSQFEYYSNIFKMDSQRFFTGEKPLLIDEWQTIPDLWDAARYYVDNAKGKGQLILTGSVTLDAVYDRIEHSGAGRFGHLRMRTLTLWESGKSTGEISIRALFGGQSSVAGISELKLDDVVNELVRGGWPETAGMSDLDAHIVLRSYCETILNAEINTVDGKERNPEKMRSVLRSLSRNTASAAKASTIEGDILAAENVSVSKNTIYDYFRVLKDICVTEDLPAWSPKLRSKTTIRTSHTRHLSDPAIAAYFLGSGRDDLLYDPDTLGLLFESMVVRDIRVYAQALEGEVYHYRDEDNLEVDAIIHLWDGRWGAVEIKLGPSWVEDGVGSLMKLRNKVDTKRMKEPSFLMVVIPWGVGYTREDGIHVVPLSCLRD